MTDKKRVAVIGAGPSGLAALRAFKSAFLLEPDQLQDIMEVVCFEKQDDWGGLWNYTDLTGLDAYGEPIHTSMYRHLFSNGPKECLEFADYTFDEHFQKPIPSYPPRIVLWDYIQGRVNKANVRGWCRFRTPVRWVEYNETTEQFQVTVHDLEKDHVYTETFDYVIVASGHFSTPNLVLFEGYGTFPGKYMHSHDFRNAEHYQGQDLLIVGSSYSAEDIALQCWKYGAKSVTLSYRTDPMGISWPDHTRIEERPLLTKIQGKTVYFRDQSSKEFDTIVLCTGFRHYFPFLPDSLRLKTENWLWIPKLYKGVVWYDNPKLFYLGMQDQEYTFNMFDAQAWYVRDVILGRIVLPSSIEQMEQEDSKWADREENLQTESDGIWFQGDYVKQLISETDYPNLDTDAINRESDMFLEHKQQNILTYRDQTFASVITGTMASTHPVAWVDLRDDSLESWYVTTTMHMGNESAADTTATTTEVNEEKKCEQDGVEERSE